MHHNSVGPGRIGRALASLLLFASISLFVQNAPAASVTIDASQTFQTIDGFGVNANHRAWNGDDLKPVLDQLIDNAGMTVFRVIYDNADWEMDNDNDDPNVMNWDYYTQIYTNAEFQKLWGIMGYLNQKGITNGLMPDFQGFGPTWMSQGGLNYRSLAGGMEPEWAEMIASAIIWARLTNHLQFQVFGPNNEPDLPGSGFGISNGVQYAITLDYLAQQLDANGLSDLKFVGPDLAVTQYGTNWMPDIMADPTVMAKLAHFGLHSYAQNGAQSELASDFIAQSPYPDRSFWMTEFNVDCPSCQAAGPGTNSWGYARAQAEYLLAYLALNASAAMVWDGYDSPYLSNSDDSIHWTFWGLFAANTNHVPITYTARKGFYTLSQISKYVRPGAVRIALSGSTDPLQVLAFYHPTTGQLTIAGVNSDSRPAPLTGTLASLQAITKLNLIYTTSASNLKDGGSVAVSNNTFSVNIPADSVFTLIGMSNGVEFAASTFNGVFQQADRDHNHSGSFTLQLTKSGTYTGKLRRGANSFPIHGSFDLSGHSQASFFEFRTNNWTVSMDLGRGDGSNWLTGTVSNSAGMSDLLAERCPFNNRLNPATSYSGTFTFIIPGQTNEDGSVIEGDGYGTIVISTAGLAKVKGTVADGTSFQVSVPIGDGGQYPIYASLNKGHDSVLGWMTNQPEGGITGALSWIKTANASAHLYSAGLTNSAVVTGWRYTAQGGAAALGITNGMAEFDSPLLSGPLMNGFTNANGRVIDQTLTNKFSLRFQASSGTFTGSIKIPGLAKPAPFRGAIAQPQGTGFGFVLFTNSSGKVSLSPGNL